MSSKTVAMWTMGLVLGLVIGQAARGAPVGSEFTYQGFLEDGNGSVTNTCDFDFSLWDDTSAGMQVGQIDSHAGVSVENGLFTVVLDFDEGIFTGQALWLEVSAQCTGDAMPETLIPRQKLTPSGYAHGLRHLYTEQIPDGTDPSIVAAVNVIGGIAEVDPGVIGATISGGGRNGTAESGLLAPNRVSAPFGTIGGGLDNTAAAGGATVGGGWENTAAGDNATVSGGSQNTADAHWTSVGGGVGNAASGISATVPGGASNTAIGAFSFASGRRAKADHDGAFVWADSTDADFASTAANQFLIRASGNVGINKNDPAEALDVAGNIRADGTISSGNSITIDGVNDQITAPTTLEIHVGGARVLRLEPNANSLFPSPNLIGGYEGNSVKAGLRGATISGGGSLGSENSITGSGEWGAIGGGAMNSVAASYTTVAGGGNNSAGSQFATVGGGGNNTAGGEQATVAGGYNNSAVAIGAGVGGGVFNAASGRSATVPGGESNQAGGDYSFAAGRRAKIRDAAASGDADGDEGTFVWADGTDADFTSTGPNQFLIRASGGVGIGTTAPSEALHVVGNARVDGTASADAFSSHSPLMLQTAGVTRIYADDATGNVGIGTTVPAERLDVAGNVHASGMISSGSGLYTSGGPTLAQVRFESNSKAGTWLNLGNTSDAGREFALVSTGNLSAEGLGKLLFRDNTAAAVRMMIDQVGRVGIGTAAPNYSLHVKTSGAANGIKIQADTGATFPQLRWTDDTDTLRAAISVDPSDSPAMNLYVNGDNRVHIDAAGNVGIGTDSPGYPLDMASGAHVTVGGVWTNACSRDWKENFTPADGRETLDKVAALPIAEWNYKSENDSTRHIGPVAEDFHVLFGTGADNKHLAALDTSGVALAAIQGLYEIVQEKERELSDVQARNKELEARVAALERLIAPSAGMHDPK